MKDKLSKIRVKRPAVLCIVLVIALSYISNYIGLLTAVLLAANVVAVILLCAFKKYKMMIVFLIVTAVSLNLFFTYRELGSVRSKSGKTVFGNFTVVEDSAASKGYSSFRIKADKGELPKGTVLEPFYYGDKALKSGDKINAYVTLKNIPVEKRKIYYSDDVYVYSTVEKLSVLKDRDNFYYLVGVIRRHIKNAYLKYCSREGAGLLIAITLGDKSYLSGTLSDAIRNVGASHMVAVSGFHLAIIIGNLFYIIDYIFKNKYFRFIASILSVVLFAGICGFTKSVLRAGSMFIISSAAPLFDREPDSLSSLSLSVVAVFLVSPFSIFSIGFNLSVIATFAIIYISPYFINAIKRMPVLNYKFIFPIVSLAVNSFFAALFTMPAIIKVFSKVSVLSIFTNLFLNFIVTFALLFGALAVSLLPILRGATAFLFYIADFFSKAMVFIIKGLNDLPLVILKMGNTAYYVSLIFIAFITLYVYHKNKKIMEGEWR
ncbi:MAG: ComEC/Rec2 family competence protein [Clostridia bacterium]|nr:ComEC/Rec2 family competence protein [Clostridia bacterium]